MRIEASFKTAAIAGAWAVFGLVPFGRWIEHYKPSSVLSYNLLYLAAAAIFFFVPGYFLVLGSGNEPFSRNWFLDQEERARYGVIVKRMLVWFVSGGVVMAIWTPIFDFLLEKVAG